MAIETGTASGYIDFIRKLRSFIFSGTGADWDPVLGGAAHGDSEAFEYASYSRGGTEALFNGLTTSHHVIYTGDYIAFRMVNATEIGSIDVTVPSLTGGVTSGTTPASVKLETSTDGISWSTAKEWTGEPVWVDLETRTFTLDAPVTSSWWRLSFPASNFSNYCYVAEVQLFNASRVRHYVNYQNSNTLPIMARFFARSPFSAGSVHAHIGVQAHANEDTKIYTLALTGYADISDSTEPGSGLPIIVGHHASSQTCCYLRDTPMDYWFYGDTRQMLGFVQVGSTIQQFGFGYLLPYATPQQYQLPMFVGAANSGLSYTWESDSVGDIKGFSNPGNGSLFVFSPSNVWEEVQNYIKDSNDNEKLQPTPTCLWPGSQGEYNTLRNSPGPNDTDGNYILFPLVVKRTGDSIYGEIGNLYLVPSLNLTSGDTIDIGAQPYRVFQNMWRTSQNDYCAVKEI